MRGWSAIHCAKSIATINRSARSWMPLRSYGAYHRTLIDELIPTLLCTCKGQNQGERRHQVTY